MPDQKPMVSIIIPVYNGADYVGQAIDSALAQTYENCEIIVVNDGSRDDGATERVVRAYGDKVRYFAKENGGVATAFNYGIEQMRGEYFSWLSHDDLYKPGKVKEQMDLFAQLPYDTILYAGYELFYDNDLATTISVHFEDKYDEADLNTPLFPVFRGLANGCTILFHKSHFDRVGGFNPALPTTQDYDLWFRMFRGANIHYCHQTNVLMRQHKQQGSKVIPNHLEDANRLWIQMMDSVTDVEKCETAGTPCLFYEELAAHLKVGPYTGAYSHACEMAKMEQDSTRKGLDDDQTALTAALTRQVERYKRQYTQVAVQLKSLVNQKPQGSLAKFWVYTKKEGLLSALRRAFTEVFRNR